MNTTHDSNSANQINLPLVFIATAIWLAISIFVGINGAKWFMPEAASVEADSVDALFNVLLGIATFVFLLVETTLFYFIVRFGFGRDKNDESDGPPIHGNTTLEIVWTIIPAVVVFFLTIYSLQVLIDTTEAKDGEEEIKVTGQQFFWQFQYPDDEFELLSNHVLVVPLDDTVRLDMTSRDVIHAFWVPAFRIKQDVMPGRNTEVRFTPSVATGLPNGEDTASLARDVIALETEIAEFQALLTEIEAAEANDLTLEGICPVDEEAAPVDEAVAPEEATAAEAETEETAADSSVGGNNPPVLDENGFDIVCAELCGANHGLMRGEVYVVEREDYEAYLQRLRLSSQRDALQQQQAIKCGGEGIKIAGRTIFNLYGCNVCHQLTDAGSLNMGQGPSLDNVVSDAAQYGSTDEPRDYVRTSIINPNAFIVPNYNSGIMPQNFIDRLSEEELTLLVEYLVLQDSE